MAKFKDDQKNLQLVKDLTLMLLNLTSWEEDSTREPGEKINLTWKGYPFKILNELQAEGLIIQKKGSPVVVLKKDAVNLAIEFEKKFFN